MIADHASNLVASLLNPALYPHPVSQLELIETHISWVILTGPFAYKIKKPVNFGFLDFSTLEKRRHYCEEEIRLNRRLAPGIYLDVIPISLIDNHPALGITENVQEYTVRMKQFPQEAQLDRMLTQGKLTIDHMDAIAHMLSQFHQNIAIAGEDTRLGDAEHVWHPVEENFRQIREHCSLDQLPAELQELEHWSHEHYAQLKPTLQQRKHDGCIRECHGDLHLRNLAWIEDRAVAFDCIEFNENLRWIDIMSEMAFLFMDLVDHEQPAMANRVLNTWLEDSGDYRGLSILRFYLVYRAMVRAKVAALRLDQTNLADGERKATQTEFTGYIQLARSFFHTQAPFLAITHGLSGSGKSTLARQLAENIGAIRLRSDVERKRLFGLSPLDRAGTTVDQGIYRPEASQRTYEKLRSLAADILAAGFSVIVDATFQQAQQREAFHRLSQELHIPFMIIECTAHPDVLRQRIRKRSGDASDADLQVLEHQLQHQQSLAPAEMSHTLVIDTENLPSVQSLKQEILSRCQQPL